MKSSNNLYNECSTITMREGFEPPPDEICMAFMEDDDLGIQACRSMAVHLVCGEAEVTEEDCVEIALLTPLLFMAKDLGIREIYRVWDMPVVWYSRWNTSFDQAVAEGIIEAEDEDMMSIQELNDMM